MAPTDRSSDGTSESDEDRAARHERERIESHERHERERREESERYERERLAERERREKEGDADTKG